jgi:phage terminase small subunit
MTELQKAFVREFLVDLNAAQAAIRAGYNGKAAALWGHRTLKRPDVSAAIAAQMDRRQRRTEVTQDRVVEELARIALLDVRQFYDEAGNLRDIHELPEQTAAALRGMDVVIESGGERVRKIHLADKVKALELLGRHMGMFDDRLKVTMDGDLAIRMSRIEGRRANRD